jgi:hypothetical protein
VAVNAPTHITLELISASRDCRFELGFLGVPVAGVETASNILGNVNLHALGKALYGPTTPRASQWAERRKEELDTGKFRALLTAIRRQVSRSEDARRCLHYFQTNQHRMRYPEFHAQGLCTSTGVVEAGCKVAIGRRLKRAECTGPFTAPTPSSPSAVPSSEGAFRTFGNAEWNTGPHDSSLSCRAPRSTLGPKRSNL